MRVPSGSIFSTIKPEPTDNGDTNHRNHHAPHGEATDFTSNRRTTEVSHSGNPYEDDGPHGYLLRRKLPLHQLGEVAHCGDGDSDVGDYQRNGIGIVGNKVTGFTEGILGITTHTTGVFTKAAALSERIRQGQRTTSGNQP